MKLHKLLLLAGALCAPAAAVAAPAERGFPERPIRFVIPFAPGGATDIVTRTIGPKLSTRLGQQIVPDNRAGAAGNIATELAAKAAPDGYTLVLCNIGSHAITPARFKARLTYDPVRDFTPVAMLADYPFLVVVNNDLPAKSIKELIALGKSKPGQINYASGGNGTGQQLSMELFKTMTGADFAHVPYRGAQPAYLDVISGRVPIFFDNMSGAMSLVKGGKVRALAVTSARRAPSFPELPTMAESGLDVAGVSNCRYIFAPKGITAKQRAFWENAMAVVNDDAEWKQDIAKRNQTQDFLRGKELESSLDEQYKGTKETMIHLGLAKSE